VCLRVSRGDARPLRLTRRGPSACDDGLSAEHPDYQRALKYIAPEEFEARTRRIRRAMDMSAKHEYLPPHIQAVQTPGRLYLAEAMEEARKLREERERLKNF